MSDAARAIQLVEFGVTQAYASQHTWVVPAITGFLSAYYMEDPRFRVARRWADKSGHHLWLCELEGGMSFERLVRRLQADIPPCRIIASAGSRGDPRRVVLDVPEVAA